MNSERVWLIIRKLYYLGPLWLMIWGILFMAAGQAVIMTSSFTQNFDLGWSAGIPLLLTGATQMLIGLFWMGMGHRMERRERFIRR